MSISMKTLISVLCIFLFFNSAGQATEDVNVLVVYQEPISENCRYVGEIEDYSLGLALNDRIIKTYKNIPEEKTSSYWARKFNGNLIYVRTKELQENEVVPKEYLNSVITVSHGADYYYLNAWVYSCNENS